MSEYKPSLSPSENKLAPRENPETAFHRAEEEWDRRIGRQTVAAANWRLAFFLSFLVMSGSLGASYYFANRSEIIPYIVQVDDKTGAVLSVGQATSKMDVDIKTIEHFIWMIIKKTRTLPRDLVVYENNWKETYAFLDGQSSKKFNTMAIRENHKDKLYAHITTILDLKTLTPVSGISNAYSVRWTEAEYDTTGKKITESELEAFITFELSAPQKATVMVNPIGLIVKDINVSR